MVGGLDTNGESQGIAVVGDYAYVGDRSAGFKIINIANPAAPVLVGSLISGSDCAYGVQVVGNYAYVAFGGLKIVNISHPAAPVLTGSIFMRSGYVFIAGGYAYVPDDTNGLKIINIANPAAPVLVGSIGLGSYACGVTVVGNYAYVADFYNGLKIVNIVDSTTPVLVGSITTDGAVLGVQVIGKYAYVADSYGLKIIKVDDGQPIAALQAIVVIPNAATIADGSTQQFTATGTYSDGSSRNITTSVSWNSSNTAVVSISSLGLATALEAGTTNITAMLSGVISPQAPLTVSAAVLQSIVVIPNAATIADGGTQQFTATGTYSDGSSRNITNSVNWNSSNTAVVSISSLGLATALEVGTTNITATLLGVVSSPASLTITQHQSYPTVSEILKTGAQNAILAFSDHDFIYNFKDTSGGHLEKVKITRLPQYGKLDLFGEKVAVNQEIDVESLNDLSFIPEVNWSGKIGFKWKGSNGIVYSSNEAYVTIEIDGISFCDKYWWLCYAVPPAVSAAGIASGAIIYMHKKHLGCFKKASTIKDVEMQVVI